MNIECLTLTFRLDGCYSLKEKRQRLSGLKIKYGKRPELAVIESAHADCHDKAEWSFITIGASNKQTDQVLQQLETAIAESVDARITQAERVKI